MVESELQNADTAVSTLTVVIRYRSNIDRIALLERFLKWINVFFETESEVRLLDEVL